MKFIRWNVLSRISTQRKISSIILTTHSMVPHLILSIYSAKYKYDNFIILLNQGGSRSACHSNSNYEVRHDKMYWICLTHKK